MIEALSNINKIVKRARADEREKIKALIEETRSHNFGLCQADFVLDVLLAKIKEQSK